MLPIVRHVSSPILLAIVLLVPKVSISFAEEVQPTLGNRSTELSSEMMCVFQAKDQAYWFGSAQQGVYRYDGKNLINLTTKHGLVSNCIRGIQEDRAGNIFFMSYEGIGKFDGRVLTTLAIDKDSPESGWKKQANDLWFPGPPRSGSVLRYDGKQLHSLILPGNKIGDALKQRIIKEKTPEFSDFIYDVYTIYTDQKGNLWFGTAIAGACRYDGKSFDWLFEKQLTETDAGGSFGIRSILQDKSGDFWICNSRHRYQIDPADAPVPEKGMIPYRRSKGIERLKDLNGADHIFYLSAVADAKGQLWLATYRSGVWRFDGSKTTRYPVMDGTKETTVWSISLDKQDTPWVATHSAGVYKFNGKTFEKFRP